jgi:hypothetical protein
MSYSKLFKEPGFFKTSRIIGISIIMIPVVFLLSWVVGTALTSGMPYLTEGIVGESDVLRYSYGAGEKLFLFLTNFIYLSMMSLVIYGVFGVWKIFVGSRIDKQVFIGLYNPSWTSRSLVINLVVLFGVVEVFKSMNSVLYASLKVCLDLMS